MKYTATTALIVCALAATSAFTVPLQKKVLQSSLNLVPEQGRQLVAAFEANASRRGADDDDDDDEHFYHSSNLQHPSILEEEPIGAVAKQAKAFVSRIFSIPGAVMGRHPAAEPALFPVPVEERDTDDVVLYPIVGFQFVNGGQQVVSTKSNASCRIHHLQDQEVYGWYTTACRLDSIYSDSYCEEPKIVNESSA